MNKFHLQNTQNIDKKSASLLEELENRYGITHNGRTFTEPSGSQWVPGTLYIWNPYGTLWAQGK